MTFVIKVGFCPKIMHLGVSMVFFLSLLAFLISVSYGIARPATESLFLKFHGSQSLPNVWIYMTLSIVVLVSLYNKMIYQFQILKLMSIVTGICTLSLIVLIIGMKFSWPGIYYLLYIWKDVYMVVFVEIYYTYSNSVFPIKQARWLYGFFGASGAVAGILSSFWVGPAAKNYGTDQTLWAVVLILGLTTLVCVIFSRFADISIPQNLQKKSSGIIDAILLVRKSSYLPFVLFLILTTQIVITLIDFDFNRIIEVVYPLTDQRTEITGKVYAAVNAATLILNILTGPILRLSGIPFVLLGVPVLLALSLSVFMALPGLVTIVVLKVCSKCFDYTIFKAAKECLFIPLKYDEIAQGKSVVDMLMYRVGKVGASFLVKLLIFLNIAIFVPWLTFTFIAVWIILTFFIVSRFRKLVSREEEIYIK